MTEDPEKPGAPKRLSWPVLLFPLTLLETRVLYRSWRWRILAILTLVTCAILQRPGPGFGEAAAVDFPGGLIGLRVIAALLTGGALLLALESAGRADRHRMRTLDDARPAPGLLVQSSRLIAIMVGAVPLAAVAVFFPFAWRASEFGALLAAPSIVFLGLTLIPLLFFASASGLAVRSILRRDLPALALGGALAAGALWHLVWLARVEELFVETSRSLGILLPLSGFAADAVLAALAGLGLLGVAAVTTRRGAQRTPLRSTNPPRPSRSLLRWLLGGIGRLPRRLTSLHTLLGAVLIAAGGWAMLELINKSVAGLEGSAEAVTSIDWATSVEPPGSSGVIYPPAILHRAWDLRGLDRGVLTGRLQLASSRTGEQSTAALSLGAATHLETIERTDGGVVTAMADATSGASAITVLLFDPPLGTNEAVEVVITARPSPAAARDWARTRHHLYRTFETLGPWYGEGMLIDYRTRTALRSSQPAPFSLQMPPVAGLQWVCGAAVPRDGDGRVVLEQPAPALPDSLIAAPTVSVEREIGELTVRFHVFPEHEEIAGQLLIAWEDRLERLVRAFGRPTVPLVLTETPRQVPTSPLMITSATLDRLELQLPDYADFSEPTAIFFDSAFVAIHRDIIATWVNGSFSGFEDRPLLRDALIDYLHRWGFLRGDTRQMPRLLRRDFVLVPWEFARNPNEYPFNVLAADEPGYRGPALAALRSPELRPVPTVRHVAFHHMLRGAIGDDAYVRGLRRLMQEHRGAVLTVDLYRQAMETESGQELGPFFAQWLVEGVLPRYELLEAEVLYSEDPQTRGFVYTTRAIAANLGDGRMSVPVLLDTDGDRVHATVDLEENEEKEITFTTLERPLSISLDPRGWILQMSEIDPTTRRPMRPILYLKRVRQLTEADGEHSPRRSGPTERSTRDTNSSGTRL